MVKKASTPWSSQNKKDRGKARKPTKTGVKQNLSTEKKVGLGRPNWMTQTTTNWNQN